MYPGEGPEHLENYCPDWVWAFWEVRDSHGAYKVWELWGIDWYLGLERVVLELGNTLRSVEHKANQQYDEWRKTQADKD